MQHPDTFIVRGKTFKLSEKSRTLTYSGRVTDHVTALVTHNPSGAWVASLVEKDPFGHESRWMPAIGEGVTPQAALELVFRMASEIEARYAEADKPPSRYDDCD